MVRYAEGNDQRESIISVNKEHNTLVSVRCATLPNNNENTGTLIPKNSLAYRHDRSQTASGYYMYCVFHEGWDHP